jgi:hypothetical protein
MRKAPEDTGACHVTLIAGLLLEIVRVDLQVLGPLFGQVVLEEDRFNRTDLGANPAVNAFIRINEIHLRVIVRMNAVNRADFDAGGVFGSNTRLCNYIGHRL